MKTIAILTLAALTGVASAASIFSPGDPIAGGQLNGGTFNLGSEGTQGDTNNWPGAEAPADLINGAIGGFSILEQAGKRRLKRQDCPHGGKFTLPRGSG